MSISPTFFEHFCTKIIRDLFVLELYTFLPKDIGVKAAHKMMVKLATGKSLIDIKLNFHFQAKKHLSGSDRVQQSESLDYGSYDTGDDHNLVFYDKPAPGKVFLFQHKLHMI